MGRQKKFKDPKRVSVVMDRQFLDHLHRQAAYMSQLEGKLVTINEIIRRGLEVAYPTPKQGKLKF